MFSNVDTASRIRISGTDNGGPTLSGNGRNLQISGDGPIEIASMVVEIRERDGTIKGPYSVINLRITGFSVVCTQRTKRLHWDQLRCGVIAERGQNKATDVTYINKGGIEFLVRNLDDKEQAAKLNKAVTEQP